MKISLEHSRVFATALLLLAICLFTSCQSKPPAATQPMGEVTSRSNIGPARLSLEQVQAEVEAFADQYVLKVTEVTNDLSRANPELRPRLHAIKLSIARGAYIIASGPNPVVSLLDLVVQSTLVHHTGQRSLNQILPEESAAPLLAVYERFQNQSWSLAEKALTPQEIADLRTLIDTWLTENPDVTYVAGVRFSDFARLRPKTGSASPTSVFGLLRVDPFASIDPAAREIQESRLLAERMFFYTQRLPQLMTWHVESLYHDLTRASDTQRLLTSVEAFAQSAQQLNRAVSDLPARTREELAASEQTIGNLLSQINQSLDRATQTLAQVERTADDLRETSRAVVEAGNAWEATADAVGEAAAIINPPKPPGSPDQPTSKPVTIADITAALQSAQGTAVEMRKLLEEFNSAAGEGGFVTRVNTSVSDARREAQSIVMTIAACAAAVAIVVLACALIYRTFGRRYHSVTIE